MCNLFDDSLEIWNRQRKRHQLSDQKQHTPTVVNSSTEWTVGTFFVFSRFFCEIIYLPEILTYHDLSSGFTTTKKRHKKTLTLRNKWKKVQWKQKTNFKLKRCKLYCHLISLALWHLLSMEFSCSGGVMLVRISCQPTKWYEEQIMWIR